MLLCVLNSFPSNHVSGCTYLNRLVFVFDSNSYPYGLCREFCFVLARAPADTVSRVLQLLEVLCQGRSLLEQCCILFSLIG